MSPLHLELPREKEAIEKILSEKKGRKVELKKPQRGKKKAYLDLASENAEKMMYEYMKKLEVRERNKNLGKIPLLRPGLFSYFHIFQLCRVNLFFRHYSDHHPHHFSDTMRIYCHFFLPSCMHHS